MRKKLILPDIKVCMLQLCEGVGNALINGNWITVLQFLHDNKNNSKNPQRTFNNLFSSDRALTA